jgi:hypothetical protein
MRSLRGKQGLFEYECPDPLCSFVVLLKNERQKNEHTDYGYISDSHRKAGGTASEAGVFFYPSAIWQSSHAATT